MILMTCEISGGTQVGRKLSEHNKYPHNIAGKFFDGLVSTIDPKAVDGTGCNIFNATIIAQAGKVGIRINILGITTQLKNREGKTHNVFLGLLIQ